MSSVLAGCATVLSHGGRIAGGLRWTKGDRSSGGMLPRLQMYMNIGLIPSAKPEELVVLLLFEEFETIQWRELNCVSCRQLWLLMPNDVLVHIKLNCLAPST